MKRKICVVVTARPSYSRIRTALRAIQEHPDLELQLVVAASALLERYGTAIDTIEADGFDIAAKVYMVLEGENLQSMAKTTGLGIMELATAFGNLEPDAVVTIADRYETLATTVAASYMNIPVVHVQGGEVTGSIDEKVRHAVTKLSDLHLVSTAGAAERVTRMGERPESVHVTGCPSVDIAREVVDRRGRALDFDPVERYGGVGDEFTPEDYIVVLQHPVTTEVEQSRQQALISLRAVRELNVPTYWFWPNVDAGSDGTSKAIRSFRELEDASGMRFFKSMAPSDFLVLLLGSRCLLGNSSVGIRECSYLGIPVVNVGSRQAGRERGGNVVDCAYSQEDVVAAARRQMENGPFPCDELYGDGQAGHRIAAKLAAEELTIEKRITY
ncbi:MAG: UDP-N-acetylglucosamine 2-epimerase [Acidobacteriota bacterium]